VILLPGMGGSGLDARIDKEDSPAWYCFKEYDWFRIWLAVEELLAQPCWFDNLQVAFNSTDHSFHDRTGVEIRPSDYGGIKGVEYLDYVWGLPVPFTGVYNSMIESLKEIGYEPGVTIFGSPFDFRMPTTKHQTGLYPQLGNLVAHARSMTGMKKVHIISHSLGGPTTLAFLNDQTPEWLNENIASFIPIAGPWSGAAKPLRTALSGDDFGLNVLGASILAKEGVMKIARQAGGVIQLVPSAAYWPSNDVFVTAQVNGQTKHYTTADFNQLFVDAGTPITSSVYNATKDIVKLMGPPRVTTHCIYGTGVATEHSYNYTRGFSHQPEIYSNNLGDGTVPIESLRACSNWQALQSPSVTIKEFNNAGHSDILSDAVVFEYIANVLATTAIKPLEG